ncbi:hypothetical protein QBC47DRAFT_161946 [Echria macrotheca]|uniref:Mid2 domain-containing protein n=1 Tax=Echria macrotheca TaxID=438768 RepID=A0AAJ0BI63_9PEZI|nr:hypothetical protein QBC47DRAFT_161946 [Echria macrotheca]
MRISGGRFGLTAVVVGFGTVVAADTQRVDFNKGFSDGAVVAGVPSAIFNVTSAQMSRIFGWQIANGDSLQVNTINLFVINNTNHDQIGSSNQNGAGEGNGVQPSLPFPPFATPTFTGRPQIPRHTIKRAETGLQGSLKVDSTERGGTVTVDNFQSLLGFAGLVMYFEAVWPENDGRSYSRAFTVVDGTKSNAAQSLPDASRFTDPNPVLPQSGGNGVGIATSTSTPIAATPQSDSSSSGGLGAGPIAGIVVGGVIALVALLAAIWFFCIRRRSQANDEATLGAYGNARRRTDELIAEKEANAGVDVAPHSPYSDDGGGVIGGGRPRRSSSLHHVDAAAIPPVTSHHRELSQQPLKQALIGGGGSYSPYSDHGVGVRQAGGEPGSRGGSPVPANGRTTPGGGMAATQYAHLVEEGMTEDEIRRLEEEERALDAAIEQAGRRP